MGWVINATPRPLYAPDVTRYPMCRRLGGPWTGAENSPPPEFDLRTVQPVASRCSCRLHHPGHAIRLGGAMNLCCEMEAVWHWQSVLFCSVSYFRSICAPTCSLYFRPFTLSVDIATTNVPTRILHKFFFFPLAFISSAFLSCFLCACSRVLCQAYSLFSPRLCGTVFFWSFPYYTVPTSV